jgi:Ser/Thr protein kinase RdoA (MazF antagonist)
MTNPETDYTYVREWHITGPLAEALYRRTHSRKARLIRWLEGPEWVERYEPKRRWGYLLGRIVGAIWR